MHEATNPVSRLARPYLCLMAFTQCTLQSRHSCCPAICSGVYVNGLQDLRVLANRTLCEELARECDLCTTPTCVMHV